MAIFNRRNNQANVPAEIQEYYQAERRERAGVAWLLAIGTLVVTILLAVGIFFGGRWVYRSITDNNKKPQTTQDEHEGEQHEEQPVATNSAQTDAQKKAADDKIKAEEAARQAAEQKTKDDAAHKKAEDEKKAQDAAAAAQAAQNQQRAATQTPATTVPHTGDNSQVAGASTIPNTGPADTFAVVAIVTIAAFLIHRILSSAISSKRR